MTVAGADTRQAGNPPAKSSAPPSGGRRPSADAAPGVGAGTGTGAVGDVDALQTAADRLSPAILQRRCAYWVRRLVPVFSEAERLALQPGYRYSMAQMEVATDVVFKRSAPHRHCSCAPAS